MGSYLLLNGKSETVPFGVKHHIHFQTKPRANRVSEVILHDTVTTSFSRTVDVLRKRNLSVHIVIDANGLAHQCADLLNAHCMHAGVHNKASIGIEVVNPYYPDYLMKYMPWNVVIDAGWAHKKRYVVPTPQQAETCWRVVRFLIIRGIIPHYWVGVSRDKMVMARVPLWKRCCCDGIYAHTYFHHADGAWLALYAWLRAIGRLTAPVAYKTAIKLASTPKRYVSLKDYIN